VSTTNKYINMDKYGNSKWSIDIDVSTTNMHTYMDKYGNSKWNINDIDVFTTNKYIYMDKFPYAVSQRLPGWAPS
jgi:hypothetical protein